MPSPVALLMRPIAVVLSVAIGLTINGAAAEEEFPHAFPRAGVKQLFDNARVTAWHVDWKRGIEQPYHRHRYDMAGVYLRYGPIRVTALDGTESPQRPPFEIPRPYFQPKGVTHKEEMIGFPADAPERWAIMFDLKEVPAPMVSPRADVAAAFPQPGAELAIDNERVMEWVHGWREGETQAAHQHLLDAVQVFYEAGTLQITDASGNTETRAFAIGDVRFIGAGTVDTEMAVAGNPKAVTIELK